MIAAGAFAVFVLGLRHGADPDHLAAIDNLTRNSLEQQPRLSRFVGTFFAGGHSVMVLSIAALLGYLGTKFTAHHELIETIGTWISVAVLFLIAGMNLRQLCGGSLEVTGAKTRLLPRALRNARSALVAIPVGLLFGFGFETSSQIATYAVAFSVGGGIAGALMVGAMFCLGMMTTDTLDSVLVHRMVSVQQSRLHRTMRTWIWSVTLMAVAVAFYELAQLVGWRSPVPDIAISCVLVAGLVFVFLYVYVATRSKSGAQAGSSTFT